MAAEIITVYEPIIEALETITALSDKVYHAEALKNAAAPFAFWRQTAEEEEQALDGYTGLLSGGLDVHIVARNLQSLNSLSVAVRSVLIALQGQEISGFLYEKISVRMSSPVLHEREVGMFRKVYSVSIEYQIQED